MLTPEEFPYIKSLCVNDCYAYQNFNIELHDYKPFSHLILTGKNGSGKSTILRIVDNHVTEWRKGNWSEISLAVADYATLKYEFVEYRDNDGLFRKNFSHLFSYGAVVPSYLRSPGGISFGSGKSSTVYSYFKAKRQDRILDVEVPSSELEFIKKFSTDDSTDFFISKFKQYLVNRKVNQAFSQIESHIEQVQNIQSLFDSIQDTFNKILGGTLKEIEFDRRSTYEFYLNLTDGRQITFKTLSEGFLALMSFFMDLFVRVDLIRTQVGDYSYDPCGIVLIDEPETHLHLQLQEQVLPLLTSLFPNIQFIAATHSPAVIASIKQTTIFDLTTKESRGSEETVGRSYSELMRGHFGLTNEYSGIADDIFRKVDLILKENRNQPDELKSKLRQFFVENDAFLSPSFRVELESMILENA